MWSIQIGSWRKNQLKSKNRLKIALFAYNFFSSPSFREVSACSPTTGSDPGHTAVHCPPQTILGKQGALRKFVWKILGMNYFSSNALLKLKNNALFTRWNLFCDFFMWFFLVILQISTCKNVATKHTFLKILKSLAF